MTLFPRAAALCQPNFLLPFSAPPCISYLASISACHLSLSPLLLSLSLIIHIIRLHFTFRSPISNLRYKQFLFSSSLHHCPTSSPRLLALFCFVFAHLVSAPPAPLPPRLANLVSSSFFLFFSPSPAGPCRLTTDLCESRG